MVRCFFLLFLLLFCLLAPCPVFHERNNPHHAHDHRLDASSARNIITTGASRVFLPDLLLPPEPTRPLPSCRNTQNRSSETEAELGCLPRTTPWHPICHVYRHSSLLPLRCNVCFLSPLPRLVVESNRPAYLPPHHSINLSHNNTQSKSVCCCSQVFGPDDQGVHSHPFFFLGFKLGPDDPRGWQWFSPTALRRRWIPWVGESVNR